MSHFAEIDDNNIVLRVLVGDNDYPNEGYDWFVENLGGTWIQTSYNGNIRKNFLLRKLQSVRLGQLSQSQSVSSKKLLKLRRQHTDKLVETH